MHFIHRTKKIICSALLFFIAISSGFAQRSGGQNKPFYDNTRRIHFGFTVGINSSRLRYDFSPKWYTQDTFTRVSSNGSAGFTLGGVANLHLGKPGGFIRDHSDLRLIPSLVLSQKSITFHSKSVMKEKTIESAILEAPLLLKIKSDRMGNTRFYVVGGGKIGYDLSSNVDAQLNPFDPLLSVKPINYSYEYGGGLDVYFPFFKFSPEVRVTKGINNVLDADPHIYADVFSKFRSNFILFSLYFEG